LEERPDPTDPWHVAVAWSNALTHRAEYRNVLHALTHSPSAFGDYARVADLLAHQSIASKVYYAVDDPENVAFVRFFPEVAQTSKTFAAFMERGGRYLTLCKDPDGTWRVWGLGDSMVSARSVMASPRRRAHSRSRTEAVTGDAGASG
jgi:hypothetical protein